MSQDRLRAPDANELVPERVSKEEHKELDAFCASFQVEEISFEQWTLCHSKLDLQYPVFLTTLQLEQAQKLTVRLSRTIRQNSPNGRTEKREKIEHTFELKASLKDHSVIVVKGLGDRVDDSVGDLIIIIKIKD